MTRCTDLWWDWPFRVGFGALLVALALSTNGGIARGQSTGPALTVLHLSATGSVQVAPDQLTADLVARDSAPSAATAQRKVNAAIAAGMRAARAVAGIDARAIGISVASTGDKHPAWTAQQTLELRGTDGPSLLDLAGTLQESGLAAASIDWELSPALRNRAHDEATTAALKELQARAASAAATLGLHVDHARDIRLDSPPGQPRPMPMMAMAARAAPQATNAPEDVSAEVSGDFVLRP